MGDAIPSRMGTVALRRHSQAAWNHESGLTIMDFLLVALLAAALAFMAAGDMRPMFSN